MKKIWTEIGPGALLGICLAAGVAAQTPQSEVQPVNGAVEAVGMAPTAARAADVQSKPAAAPAPMTPERKPEYVLGAEDQIVIRAFQAEEISEKPMQVGGDGFVNVPMIGRVKAGGLTVAQLEVELTNKLSTYYEHPQVTVLISDYRSQPVSVIGAVNTPGMVQLRGPKTLLQVISLAGGLRADAGYAVTITRELKPGVSPLSIGTTDPTGRFDVAQVNLRDVMDAKTPQDNVVIESGDVITVSRAQMVYVMGEVARPGGYILNDRDSLSLLQVLSLAGGLKPTASTKKAKVLREDEAKKQRIEVPSDLKKILLGDAPDMSLRADDILFVPNNAPKSAGLRAIETAVSVGTGLAVYGRY